MRRCAERERGPGADEAEIQKFAERYYWDDEDEHFREETPEESQARGPDPGDETDTGIRRSTLVTLYDSSELARTGTREFHTTWADVNGTKQRHKEIDQCQ